MRCTALSSSSSLVANDRRRCPLLPGQMPPPALPRRGLPAAACPPAPWSPCRCGEHRERHRTRLPRLPGDTLYPVQTFRDGQPPSVPGGDHFSDEFLRAVSAATPPACTNEVACVTEWLWTLAISSISVFGPPHNRAPAGHRVGLGEAIEGQRALPHLRHGPDARCAVGRRR